MTPKVSINLILEKECSCYFSGIQVPAFFQLWLLLAPTFSPFLLFSSISFSSHFHTGNNTTSVLQVSLGSRQAIPPHHGVRNKSQRTKSQIMILFLSASPPTSSSATQMIIGFCTGLNHIFSKLSN